MDNIIDYVKHIYNLNLAHYPLEEWMKINYDLGKVYDMYGIKDDEYGRNIKNTARHFTGGALGNKFYGQDISYQLGQLKEMSDAKRDKGKEWFADDNFIDNVNNHRGMTYSIQHPNATRDEIYHAAILQAIKNYNADYPKN